MSDAALSSANVRTDALTIVVAESAYRRRTRFSPYRTPFPYVYNDAQVGLSAMRAGTLTRHGGAVRLSMDWSAPSTRAMRRSRFARLRLAAPRAGSRW